MRMRIEVHQQKQHAQKEPVKKAKCEEKDMKREKPHTHTYTHSHRQGDSERHTDENTRTIQRRGEGEEVIHVLLHEQASLCTHTYRSIYTLAHT